MKAIKRTLCVLIILGIMSSLCACQQTETDTCFYVRSRNVVGDAGQSYVIDARIANPSFDLSDTDVINVEVGFGGQKKNAVDGTEDTWVSIESKGCVFNGEEHIYTKKYSDYHTNDIYRHTEKEKLWGWGYPELIPNFFEDIEMTFPEGACEGEVVFSLHDTFPNGHIEVTTVSIYYAKNENIIVFSADSEYDAQQKLETLASME